MNEPTQEQMPASHDWGQDVALDELRGEAVTPEDHAYLDQVDLELQTALRSRIDGRLGEQATAKLVQLPGGVVTTQDRLEREENAGQDFSDPDQRI